MRISRLVYISQREHAVPLDIAEMIRTSRRKNARAGVTGFLIFDGEYFAQALEGSRSAVTDTYNRIARDQRHRGLHIAACCDVTRRLFPNWPMGLSDGIPLDARKALLSKVNISCFDPNAVPVEQLLELFVTMAADAEALERGPMVLALLPSAPVYGRAGRC
jgi:hypothetical protein